MYNGLELRLSAVNVEYMYMYLTESLLPCLWNANHTNKQISYSHLQGGEKFGEIKEQSIK